MSNNSENEIKKVNPIELDTETLIRRIYEMQLEQNKAIAELKKTVEEQNRTIAELKSAVIPAVEEIEEAEAVDEIEEAEAVEAVDEIEEVEAVEEIEEVEEAEEIEEVEETEEVEEIEEVEEVEAAEEAEEAEVIEESDNTLTCPVCDYVITYTEEQKARGKVFCEMCGTMITIGGSSMEQEEISEPEIVKEQEEIVEEAVEEIPEEMPVVVSVFDAEEAHEEESVDENRVFCPQCGKSYEINEAQIQRGFVFCEICGVKIEIEVAAEEIPVDTDYNITPASYTQIPEKTVCPVCYEEYELTDEQVQRGFIFCEECGTKIEIGAKNESSAEEYEDYNEYEATVVVPFTEQAPVNEETIPVNKAEPAVSRVFCPNCGEGYTPDEEQIQRGMIFCEMCGERIAIGEEKAEEIPQEPQSSNFRFVCPTCGHSDELERDSIGKFVFCEECGTKIDVEEYEVGEVNPSILNLNALAEEENGAPSTYNVRCPQCSYNIECDEDQMKYGAVFCEMCGTKIIL